MTERLLKIEQVAERLQYSKATVYRLIRGGQLRAVRLGQGSPWRVPDSAIAELIDHMDDNQASWYGGRS